MSIRNYLAPERQQEITELVESIKDSTGLAYPEQPLKNIIRNTIPGVKIRESSFNGNLHIRGAVFRKSQDYKEPVIAIQSRQSRKSKTFAMAHEFGHYMLQHNTGDNYLIDDRQFDGSKFMQDESEAHFFAQVLLMPKEEFESRDLGFVSDSKLAKYFGVSEEVVRVRRRWLEVNGY